MDCLRNCGKQYVSFRILLAGRRYMSSSRAAENFRNILDERISAIKDAGTWKGERVITSKQGAKISVEGSKEKMLNFCANNYLGLSSHPEVVNAAKEALTKYGAGLSSVRFICGTQDIHKELEDKIATFHGREDAILYPSCFDANAGLFEAIFDSEDLIVSDELNHASIIDGVRLCKAKKFRYKHRNMQELESILLENKDAKLKLIVTDGAFSMDGSIAPLRDIVSLAKKYEALTFIDECHATGFVGRTGRGTEEYCDLKSGSIDIINSTLGKALGGASGGYTTGSKELVAMLRQRSRPYLFSNTMPPPVVGAANKVFDLLMSGSDLTTKVAENTRLFRSKMMEAGFTIGGDEHPICPVMLGDARLAVEFADEMLEQNIYVIGFTFPVVPIDTARIRVQISASHSREEIERCVNAFIKVGREKGVI